MRSRFKFSAKFCILNVDEASIFSFIVIDEANDEATKSDVLTFFDAPTARLLSVKNAIFFAI